MDNNSKLEQALEVLIRARDQLIGEIATCGNNGAVGRAQNYAPVLVNITNALDVVEKLQAKKAETEDRMAAMRAAKAAKLAQQQSN